MPERRNPEPPLSDSGSSASEIEFVSSAFGRKRIIVGQDEEDLGVTRETGQLYPERASILDNLFALLSVGTFIADIGMDIVVARQYFLTRHYTWFGLTVAFIVIPSVILQVFSSRWYREDDVEQTISSCGLHIILLGPVERYLNAFYYGCKTYIKKEVNPSDFVRYLTEWRDITMLRLFEAFLESAPQVVLQLYVLITLNVFVPERDWQTAVAAISSIISIAWAIASYSHALRLCCKRKGLSWFGYIFQIWYRLFMVSSRVVAFVLFASVFKEWIFLVVGIHFTAMFIWLSVEKSYFCPAENRVCESLLETGFNAVISTIYVFCFINIHKGATRHRVLGYYTVFLSENLMLLAFWFPNRTIHGALMYAAFGVVIGGFALGVISMLFYYKFFHPKQDITEGWFPWKCCNCATDTSSSNNAAEDVSNDVSPDEESVNRKSRTIDVPRSIKLKGGSSSWRSSLLAASPGTPIDIELPFRFNQHTGSSPNSDFTHSFDMSGQNVSGGDYKGIENRGTDTELQFHTNNKRTHKIDVQKMPTITGRMLPTDSENTSMETLIRPEVNHNSEHYPCDSIVCYSTFHNVEQHTPIRNNISNNAVLSRENNIEDTSACSTISNNDDIRFLGDKNVPAPSSHDQYSSQGASPGTSFSELSHDQGAPQAPRNDDSCFQVAIAAPVINKYIHANTYGAAGFLESDHTLPPYSPHHAQQRRSFPVDDSQFSQDTDSSSRSAYSADTERALFGEIEKEPLTNKRHRRGRSKSLPDKHVMRQTVVDWMVDRLQTERLKDVVRRPHSDMGNYTVTVNVNGNDYYTSLV